MPTPTQQNADRINQLNDLFNALSNKVDRLAETTNTDSKKFQDAVGDTRGIVDELRDGVRAGEVTDARHDERLKSLEKGSDRRWQLAPIVLTGVSVVVSLVSAVVSVFAVTEK